MWLLFIGCVIGVVCGFIIGIMIQGDTDAADQRKKDEELKNDRELLERLFRQLNKNNKHREEYSIFEIDFFCGAGGFTKGLTLSGINVLAGIDNNIKCRDIYT